VSGEPSELVGLGAATEPLVRALDALSGSGLEFVLVGGLAVMTRLQTAHRATQDLDALNGDDEFKVICARRGVGELAGDTLTVEGVKIDSISVDDTATWDSIAELDDPLQRLFVAGHLFAHHDVGVVRVVAGASQAEIAVASVRALLVTKLHAYLSPRRRPEKQASDALDVVRLAELVARQRDAPLRRGAVPDVVAAAAATALDEVAADRAKLIRRLRVIGAASPVGALFDVLLEDLR
jgi:predicted nucleotidyltransferase